MIFQILNQFFFYHKFNGIDNNGSMAEKKHLRITFL